MEIVGIICEYNPLHRGHVKQFDHIRQQLGNNTAIVCLMSGNFVQRGAPAIIDKSARAKAAVLSGADLVLELPVPGDRVLRGTVYDEDGQRFLHDICFSGSFGHPGPVPAA